MTLIDRDTATLPSVTPQMMVGAASPLWALFAGATLSGMAFWWSARLFAPKNLEAMLDAAPLAVLSPAVVAPAVLELPEPAASEVLPEPAFEEPVALVAEPAVAASDVAPAALAIEVAETAIAPAVETVEAVVEAVSPVKTPRTPSKTRAPKSPPAV